MDSKTCSMCNIEKHNKSFDKKCAECNVFKSKKGFKRYCDNKDKMSNQRNIHYIKNKHKTLQQQNDKQVVEVGAGQTGGGGGGRPTCIKIGYSSREPRRVSRPCIKIGYSSAMY